jgi:hypothetical protein
MPIVTVILILLVIVACAYVLNNMLTIPPPINWLLNVIIGILVIVFLLSVTGLLGSVQSIRV